MKRIKEKIKVSVHAYYQKFIQINARPKAIASGMALGLFIGMSPTMGFQMPLAFLCASFLEENKMAAMLGVWITNPLTAPIIYPINYQIGVSLVGGFFAPSGQPMVQVADYARFGAEVLVYLSVGGIVSGIFVAMIGYFSTLWLVIAHREKIAVRTEQPLFIDLHDKIDALPPFPEVGEEATYH